MYFFIFFSEGKNILFRIRTVGQLVNFSLSGRWLRVADIVIFKIRPDIDMIQQIIVNKVKPGSQCNGRTPKCQNIFRIKYFMNCVEANATFSNN